MLVVSFLGGPLRLLGPSGAFCGFLRLSGALWGLSVIGALRGLNSYWGLLGRFGALLLLAPPPGPLLLLGNPPGPYSYWAPPKTLLLLGALRCLTLTGEPSGAALLLAPRALLLLGPSGALLLLGPFRGPSGDLKKGINTH